MLVLDDNHGIDHRDSIYKLNPQGTAPAKVYVPWYIKTNKNSRFGYESLYYTHTDGWFRVEYDTWIEAYNHIARSRGLPTSKHVRSTYVQEAKNAGVILQDVPTTVVCEVCMSNPAQDKKTICYSCENPWSHPAWDSLPELDQEW